MGNTSVAETKLIQETVNNIANISVATASANCTNIEQDSTYIIEGTTIGGDLEFVQACEVRSDVVINNAIDTAVNNIIDAIQKQKQTTESLVFQQTANVSVLKQEAIQNIRNNIFQSALSTCTTNVENIINNRTVILRNTQIKNSSIFAQKGQGTMNCLLNNIASIEVFNKSRAEQEQTQSTTVSWGLIGAIVAAVVILVVVGFVMFNSFKQQGGGGAASQVRIVQASQLPKQ